MTGRRRWPLLVIGASAGVAVWSGWVGLGGMTGFGEVQPLPGIWDGLTIDTAITLPIGVEAYGVYALSVATDPADLPRRVRRVAWASAGGALALGGGAQVAYHLMAAQGVTQAPWWVIAAVAVLPVVVLGAAGLLWHLRAAADAELERVLEAKREAAAVRAADRERRAQTATVEAPRSEAPRAPDAAVRTPVPDAVPRRPAARTGGDVRELLPAARAVAADLRGAGRSVTRRALTQGLRERSLSCSNERAGALLALLDEQGEHQDDEGERPARLLASA